jgi:hypothetical protein
MKITISLTMNAAPLMSPLILTGSQDISVGIAARLWTGQPRSVSPDRGKMFCSPVFRLALKPTHIRIAMHDENNGF